MNVMVVGKGGREHAIVKRLRASASVAKVFVAPGHAGFDPEAECVAITASEDLAKFCKANDIGLVIIGPETELVSGLADILRASGLNVFGPSQKAAQLEASKIFSKEFMIEFGIPTAHSVAVTSTKEIENAIAEFKPPYVLKADGLCAGKGVFICKTKSELIRNAKAIFEDKIFGESGTSALLEQFTPGEELSVFVLTNGKDYQILPLFRDHKRLLDGDEGPNTGGMGVVGPINVDTKLWQTIEDTIVRPTVAGFQKRRFDYRGVVFIGVMVTDVGPSVLEYNVRFGDPETQCLMPVIAGDLAAQFLEIAQGRVPKFKFEKHKVACVVMASAGYPESPKLGDEIKGEINSVSNEHYFLWAGVKKSPTGLVTNGGRVANAVGIGGDLKSAIRAAYAQAKKITWPGVHFRTDIGKSV